MLSAERFKTLQDGSIKYVLPLSAFIFDMPKRFVTDSVLRYVAFISTHALSSVIPVTVYVAVASSQFPDTASDFVIVKEHSFVISCDPYITIACVLTSGNVPGGILAFVVIV